MTEQFVEHRNLRIAGTVVLYRPDSGVISNIQSYLDDVGVLYVVDNSETRHSNIVEQILEFDKVVYLPNGENLGIARALNIAADRAIADGYDFLLTMDQDSCAAPAMIKNLLGFINDKKRDNIGIISPVHNICPDTKSSTQHLLEEVKFVMTSGNLLNLEVYNKVGRFADELFIDCIDYDYCLRLDQAGYKIFQVNNAILHHKLGHFSHFKILYKSLSTSNHSPLRRYYNTRNRFYIWKTYGAFSNQFVKQDKRRFLGEIRNILFGENERMAKFRMMIKGYLDYRKGTFGKYER
jgi:rhamnosyltransferase